MSGLLRLAVFAAIATSILASSYSDYFDNYEYMSQQCTQGTNCHLPDCYCAGYHGPHSLHRHATPQIVMISFDDAVNEQNYKFYRKLFDGRKLNPNGCPISGTFFVSHNWTDYSMVRRLHRQGHELAVHSVTHRLPHAWWQQASYKDWVREMVGQRINIARKAKIPISEVVGARVPFLEIGGNAQVRALRDNGFVYDASFMTGPVSGSDWKQPVWPYTLDYPPTVDYCDNGQCPSASFRSFWEVPLNRWVGNNGKSCAMVDGCQPAPSNKKEALTYIWKNFNRHYKGSRAPFGVNLHAVWFDDLHTFRALEDFVTHLLTMDDVYLVTVSQMLEWVKTPVALKDVGTFKPWMKTCPTRQTPEKPKTAAKENPKFTTTSAPENDKYYYVYEENRAPQKNMVDRKPTQPPVTLKLKPGDARQAVDSLISKIKSGEVKYNEVQDIIDKYVDGVGVLRRKIVIDELERSLRRQGKLGHPTDASDVIPDVTYGNEHAAEHVTVTMATSLPDVARSPSVASDSGGPVRREGSSVPADTRGKPKTVNRGKNQSRAGGGTQRKDWRRQRNTAASSFNVGNLLPYTALLVLIHWRF